MGEDYNEISYGSFGPLVPPLKKTSLLCVLVAGVPSAALYPPAMSYPFYQPVIQPMVNIKLQLKSISHLLPSARTFFISAWSGVFFCWHLN
jgi:hypothetical protein